MISDPLARDMIASALGSVMNRVAAEHFPALTQEAPTTARIGEALESALARLDVGRYHVEVVTQDVPDKGRGSMESRVGADTYVGIRVQDGANVTSKGLLAQAKWRDATKQSGDLDALADQCRRMINKSSSSYVWLYGPTGVRVVSAKNVVHRPDRRPEQLWSRGPDRMFQRVLQCREGDEAIGLPNLPDASPTVLRQALGNMLKRLEVPSGVAVSVTTG